MQMHVNELLMKQDQSILSRVLLLSKISRMDVLDWFSGDYIYYRERWATGIAALLVACLYEGENAGLMWSWSTKPVLRPKYTSLCTWGTAYSARDATFVIRIVCAYTIIIIYNFDPYNVSSVIATNIAVLLMTVSRVTYVMRSGKTRRMSRWDVFRK